jgi:cytochrome c oxidase subunit II
MKKIFHTAIAAASSLAFTLHVAAQATPTEGAGQPVRWQLNMTEGVTETSKLVYDLHMQIFLICCVIGAIVFGAMFYSMYKFRKSKGAVAATWSHNTTAEVIWTVVPILILVVMAIPATDVLYKMYDTSKPEMTVEIRGYQWLWEYKYHGQDLKFTSRLKRESDETRRLGSGKDPNAVKNYLLDVDRPLVLPADTKIRFVISADDVIHAWWVPVLGWKQDAIPGYVNEAWTKIPGSATKPGGVLYRGQCAELCGKDHGFMPIVVKVVPKAEFAEALAVMKAELNGVGTPAPQLASAAAASASTVNAQ